MESNSMAPQQREDDVMEVPEIDGDLLVELLDASLAAEDNAGQALGFAADVDGDCWIDSQEPSCGIHAHQDCEDCGLDGILSDFEEYGSARARPSPAPYAFFGDEDTLEWAETTDAGMGPFAGGCMGDWYMDGMVMAMEWEEEEEGGEGSAFSFEPCYGGGEAGAEQVYGSPLWE
ncbi:hypothetical protein SEVIR_5G326500v4 [Setaria viridis]|uniref:Uncharacterized protein n=1 Tax=Setaria viridis TaxID=4556 RepID=A0A4U6US60_SETVI|nr:uncharacterized protein LOC117858704 [Setaria viridis]TKW16849.1 hypothetical protein SEVIR_5G326500v2 [Setaria viridis]